MIYLTAFLHNEIVTIFAAFLFEKYACRHCSILFLFFPPSTLFAAKYSRKYDVTTQILNLPVNHLDLNHEWIMPVSLVKI